MAQRRFGPTLGAGVAVIEKQAQKLIDPAPLGVTLYITPLEKGDPSKLISTLSKKDMLKKVGDILPGFIGPDCAQDFWDHSGGAGELHFLRVAGAGLRAAVLDLVSRQMTNLPYDFAGGKSVPLVRVTAKSGGRWGNAKRVIHRTLIDSTHITATQITTGLAMLQDEWVGGVLALDGISAKTYPIIGNTTSGAVSVPADSNILADYGVATDLGFSLILPTPVDVNGLNHAMAIGIRDGQNDPVGMWAMDIYVNETLVKSYQNLSMDPTSKYYFLNLINDDQTNEWITVSDLWAPNNPAGTLVRPTNYNGIVSSVTAKQLVSKLFQVRRTAGLSNPSFAISGDTDVMQYADTLELECTVVGGGNATFTMKSKRLCQGDSVHANVVASNTNSTAFAFNANTCPLLPTVTMTCGTTVFVVGDKFQLDYMPFEPNKLVGGYVVPDIINKPNARFRITSNDHKTINTQAGDMTVEGGGGANDEFMVLYPQELGGPDALDATVMNGYDALAALGDSDYTELLLNASASPALALLTQDKGLVKVACPGATATAIQKAGLAFAEALNWQFRVEIPDNIDNESDALTYINTTIGRNDYGVTIMPSYADINDRQKPGMLKRVSLTGAIHGREALVAKQFRGYHKAAAGIDVTLPNVVQLPFSQSLDEEILNPQGINVVKKKGANFIVWGDRTISVDPNWKWKHQRELMSHYENQLREGFDFIIFALNNSDTQQQLITTLKAFFLPEYVKKAVTGETFADAVSIKIDGENNTQATMDAGDLNADISLQLADTVERFNINIGKVGISDSVSS